MDKKTLKVGFDAKRAFLNTTGLGNYSRRVIDEMVSTHRDWAFELFTPRVTAGTFSAAMQDCGNAEIVTPTGFWRRASSLWRVKGGMTAAMRRSGIELFHGLSNELPLDIVRSGIPSVVTIHDVIYRRFPDNYKAIDRRIYDYKYGMSARNATRIVAISRCTARDVAEFYDVDPAKIDIIYQPCHPQFSAPMEPSLSDEFHALYPMIAKRYIAMVGTVERRKNQLLAVRALPAIDPKVELLIVGRGRLGYDKLVRDEARRLGVAHRVKWLSSVPFRLLPVLYAEAEIAAYPSRYEGFGLPVVEALSSGTPVIAATGSCLEEAGGAGGVYVDPDDADGFAAAANDLLNNSVKRAEMVHAGRGHIASLLSTPMCESLTETYRKIV